MAEKKRLVHPTAAELLDRLSINQIKQIFSAKNQTGFALEMKRIEHDLERHPLRPRDGWKIDRTDDPCDHAAKLNRDKVPNESVTT